MKEEIEKNLCRRRLYNGGGQWSVLVLVMVLKLAGDRRVASFDPRRRTGPCLVPHSFAVEAVNYSK